VKALDRMATTAKGKIEHGNVPTSLVCAVKILEDLGHTLKGAWREKETCCEERAQCENEMSCAFLPVSDAVFETLAFE